MKRLLASAVLSVSLLGLAASVHAEPADAPAAAAPLKKAKVGVIHLSETLKERPESFQLSLMDLSGNSAKGPSISNLIVTLNKAAKDTSLNGLLIDLSAFSLSLNQAQELGELITQVRKSGKRVAVYSSDYDTDSYILASYADTVIMPENGNVLIPGVGLQMMFFKDALSNLKLQADFVQVGKFKGAEEPFMRSFPSPEYKEQIQKLVDGMYTQIISTISANRPNIEGDGVKNAVDVGWLSGRHAKEAGLVDQLLTRDKVDAWVEAQFKEGAELQDDYGKPKKKSLDLDSPFAIFSLLGDTSKTRTHQPAVAVIYALGEIVPDFVGGEDSTTLVSPAAIRKDVQAALKDDLVKAIVVRVDSPGGSASASDEIWSVLKEADKKKPVTISMGRVAASGGYYISCAGRSITADPATITGSIGVVGGKIVIKGLLDYVGVNVVPISRGKHVGMLSMLTPFSPEEREFIQKSMEETYGVFESRVKGARGEKVAKLEEVAQGRLFTGQQAKDVGLVDTVGTLNDTVLAAAKAAAIDKDYQIIILPETKTIADVLRDSLLGGEDMSLPIGLKLTGMDALVQSLPPELRGQMQGAVRMMNIMQKEGMLMGLPGGITEMTR